MRVLYLSEKGRFRVGVGLGDLMKVYIYIKLFFIFFFYKCMQSIKLRQTTENNGGPCKSKNDVKCSDQALICDELGVRTC